MQALKESLAFFGKNPDPKRGNLARNRPVATGSVEEPCSVQISGVAERTGCRTNGDNILLRKNDAATYACFRWRPASWVEAPYESAGAGPAWQSWKRPWPNQT